jgi:hypothetical protein
VPEVVALLEDFLEAARRGELVSIAVIGLDQAGEGIEGWTADDVPALVFEVRGAVIRMQQTPEPAHESKH